MSPRKTKKIKVLWNDAVIYKPHHPPKGLSRMETVGILFKEDESYLIIKSPRTHNIETRKAHPENKRPTFFFIPKKLVISIQ